MFKQIVLLVCVSLVLAAEKESREEVSSLNQDEFGSEALMAHNLYRKIHGVPALRLNAKLSVLALNRAQELAKDGKLNVKQILFKGENLGETVGTVGGFSSYNGISATQLWYSVVSKFDEEGESSNEGASFTQMVWKKTEEVGFGIAKAKDGKFFFVAEYFPSGNIRGKYEDNVFQLTDEVIPAAEERSGPRCVNQTVVDMWKQLLVKANINVEPLKMIEATPIVEDSEKVEMTPLVKPVTTKKMIPVEDDEVVSTTTTQEPITSTRRMTTTKTTEADEAEATTMRIRQTTTELPIITKTTTESMEEETTSTRRIRPVTITTTMVDSDMLISSQVEVEMSTTRRPTTKTMPTVHTTRRVTTVNPDLIVDEASEERLRMRTTEPTRTKTSSIRTTTSKLDEEEMDTTTVVTRRPEVSKSTLLTKEKEEDNIDHEETRSTTMRSRTTDATIREPTTRRTTTEEPTTRRTTTEGPVTRRTTTEEPTTRKTTTEEQITRQTTTEEPVTRRTTTEEPTTRRTTTVEILADEIVEKPAEKIMPSRILPSKSKLLEQIKSVEEKTNSRVVAPRSDRSKVDTETAEQ